MRRRDCLKGCSKAAAIRQVHITRHRHHVGGLVPGQVNVAAKAAGIVELDLGVATAGGAATAAATNLIKVAGKWVELVSHGSALGDGCEVAAYKCKGQSSDSRAASTTCFVGDCLVTC